MTIDLCVCVCLLDNSSNMLRGGVRTTRMSASERHTDVFIEVNVVFLLSKTVSDLVNTG